MASEGLVRWRHSATLRIALIHSAAILLATALLGALVVHAFHVTVQRQVDQRITDDMRSLVHHYRRDGRAGLLRAMAQRADMMPDLLRGAFTRDGSRIAGSAVLAVQPPGWRQIILHPRHIPPIPARALAVRLGDGSTVLVASAGDAVGAAAAPITRLFVFQALAVAMLGIVSALLLSRYLRRRLEAMAETARAIMVGRLERRMPIGGDDEFDRLATVLNAMLDRIGALIGNLRQVSSDIAHDLRTPLTRLRYSLEQMQDSGADTPLLIDDALAQTDGILDTFQALLRIGTVEGGVGRRHFRRVDLSDLMDRIHQAYEPVAEDAAHSLRADHAPGLFVEGDAELLAQLFTNLIENAIVHTPPGTIITSRLALRDGLPTAEICDTGSGIPEAERENVFRRFYRLDASRHSEGSGLGLALVAAIASLHGARHVIPPTDGLCVRIIFPSAGGH